MATHGIDPRLFSANPTVELDPRLYALDPNQIGGASTILARNRELQQEKFQNAELENRDRHESNQERHQQEELRQSAMIHAAEGKRDQSRIDLAASEEKRRTHGQSVAEADEKRKELEDAIRRAQQARNPYELERAKEELERLGIEMRPVGPHLGEPQPTAPPHVADAVAPKVHFSDVDVAATGKDLDQASAQADKTVKQLQASRAYKLPGLVTPPRGPMGYQEALDQANGAGLYGVKQVPGGWTPIPKEESYAADADNNRLAPATSGTPTMQQLNGIERRYLNGLRAPATLPGAPPFRRSASSVASDQMLSPGDSLLRGAQ